LGRKDPFPLERGGIALLQHGKSEKSKKKLFYNYHLRKYKGKTGISLLLYLSPEKDGREERKF